ncbi:MAG: hypothetical protein RL483_429 [Pseudomonadota bacterium]
MIQVEQLGKSYQRGDQSIVVLDRLDLTVQDGEFVALMGPSGSGKSTLLNLIAGIDRPTAGTIRIDGIDIGQLDEASLARWRAKHVGFVFQFYNLIPVLTAAENVALPLTLSDLPAAQRSAQVAEALAAVGLADRAGHIPSELSGGQQQRVAIARAASSSGSRLPGPSLPIPVLSWPMSPPAISIGSQPRTFWPCSSGLTKNGARPSLW